MMLLDEVLLETVVYALVPILELTVRDDGSGRVQANLRPVLFGSRSLRNYLQTLQCNAQAVIDRDPTLKGHHVEVHRCAWCDNKRDAR